MTDEPTTEPINEDDNTPATKGDLAQLEKRIDKTLDALTTDVEGIDARLMSVEGRLTKVEENTGRILDIVTSIDKQNKHLKDIPQKVAEHSEDILALKMKS